MHKGKNQQKVNPALANTVHLYFQTLFQKLFEIPDCVYFVSLFLSFLNNLQDIKGQDNGNKRFLYLGRGFILFITGTQN